MKSHGAIIRVKAISWGGYAGRAEATMHFANEADMATKLQALDRNELRAMFPDYREVTSYSVECVTKEYMKLGNVNRTIEDRWPFHKTQTLHRRPQLAPDCDGPRT